MIIETGQQPKQRQHSQSEMKIQAECVRIAWNEFPETRYLLFHVKNELDRPDANIIIGSRARATGIVRGVSDLLMLLPRNGYHGLCIEMKTETGRQSDYQREWQARVEQQGYKYVVCRSTTQFRQILTEYLTEK